MIKTRKNYLRTFLNIIFISSLVLTGCSEISSKFNSSDSKREINSTQQMHQIDVNNYTPRLDSTAVVEMSINDSSIIIEINGREAPITAGNYIDLVERGFYNGLVFHRVIKDPTPFVAQGGDPDGTGMGGFVDPKTKQRRYIPLEIKLENDEKPIYNQSLGIQGSASPKSVVLKHKRGSVAMARSAMPDSASSQFYVALSDLDFLNGDYAVFGTVIEGMKIVDNIKEGDRISSMHVISGLENFKK